MLTDEWPASSKFLFCARPGAARCSHRKKTSIAVVPDAATAKLQEMARGSHRESTQQVEKPPIANFRECCRYCKMLQDVAMLHNCKTGSQRVSRPPPLNSPSSILSKTPKLHFSIFFATLQEPVQLQPTRAFSLQNNGAQRGAWPAHLQHEVDKIAHTKEPDKITRGPGAEKSNFVDFAVSFQGAVTLWSTLTEGGRMKEHRM